MVVATVCQPIRRAKDKTESASRSVCSWLGQRDNICGFVQEIVDLSIEVVNSWKEVRQAFDGAIKRGELDDIPAIVDGIRPSISLSRMLLAVAKDRRQETMGWECASSYSTNFDVAVSEMEEIALFFERWPQSADAQCEDVDNDQHSADLRLGFWAEPRSQFSQKHINEYESIRSVNGIPSLSRIKAKRAGQNQ